MLSPALFALNINYLGKEIKQADLSTILIHFWLYCPVLSEDYITDEKP